jgi:hypothetical protein
MILRLAIKSINLSDRATRDVHLMDIVKKNTVASLARMSKEAEEVVETAESIDFASGGIGNGDLNGVIGTGNGNGSEDGEEIL